MIAKARLYYHTLKYLKPVQIYGRVFSGLKKKFHLYNLPPTPAALKPGLNPKTDFLNHDPWNNTEDLGKKRFCFLNHTIDMGSKINWEPNADQLWKFNLHYFSYLYLLAHEEQKKICKEWILNNPAGKGTGWHSYTLSLRITNWCKIGLSDKDFNQSLYQQAAYLYRNLEFYHPANHYLENARALIFAGLCFKDQGEAARWFSKGLRIIEDETPKQVMHDGGYFELSIMYHALMIELYLDLLNVLPEDISLYSYLSEIADSMLGFLNNLTHPDGNIVLFNDSTQEIAATTKKLNEYSKKLTDMRKGKHSTIHSPKRPSYNHTNMQPYIHAFPDSGYYVCKDEKIFLAIDAGSIGPDNIPAHSHADIFSYEFSLKGVQFIVDTGVYEYNDGEMRNYVRSTGAHNTVTIDDVSQAECWGGFRVGKRFSPESVKFNRTEKGISFEGIFTGYSELIGDGLEHKRILNYSKKKNEIKIIDFVSGKGRHSCKSFIHLHPEVKIKESDNTVMLERDSIQVRFITGNYNIEESYYCSEFGKRIKNKTISIGSDIPANLEYSFIII
jgi:uncharacterized heparinase superfamily protein